MAWQEANISLGADTQHRNAASQLRLHAGQLERWASYAVGAGFAIESFHFRFSTDHLFRG